VFAFLKPDIIDCHLQTVNEGKSTSAKSRRTSLLLQSNWLYMYLWCQIKLVILFRIACKPEIFRYELTIRCVDFSVFKGHCGIQCTWANLRFNIWGWPLGKLFLGRELCSLTLPPFPPPVQLLNDLHRLEQQATNQQKSKIQFWRSHLSCTCPPFRVIQMFWDNSASVSSILQWSVIDSLMNTKSFDVSWLKPCSWCQIIKLCELTSCSSSK